ncbi:MAG: diphthine--ammonia ligase [archaeon]
MRVIILFSGGKDSTYAAWWAVQQGFEIVSLLSALPLEGSLMFHHPNAALTKTLAEAMELPWESFEAGKGRANAGSSSAELERVELEALETALAKFSGKADAVVSGALASNYQKTRIDAICERLGLKSLAPLWHVDQEKYLREIVSAGFEIVCAGAFAEGLGPEWLGKRIDPGAIDELVRLKEKYSVSVGGEGGEWESIVLDSPIHKKRVEIVSARKIWERNSGTWVVEEARLVRK